MILGDPGKFQGPAKTNYDNLSRLPIDMRELKDLEPARLAIADYDIVIDAIFGTGLSRDVEGLYREVIELINVSDKPVLSIDTPSGVHGNTGKVMGVTFKANVTVTFGLPKLGNVLSPGYEFRGKLFVLHISFPPSLHQSDSLKIEINDPPPQDLEKQKSAFGKVLTVGGDFLASEHPRLCIVSFLQSEGDDSHQATAKSHDPATDNKGSQMRITPQKKKSLWSFSTENKETLLQLVEEVDMVILGSGTSFQEETRDTQLSSLRNSKPGRLWDFTVSDPRPTMCSKLHNP
jgi:NAD(P)H-hydrate epimerase